MTNPTSPRPDELPATVRSFLDAHSTHDVDAAITAFAGDAVVTDQGRTFRGTAELLEFLRSAGAEYTYTTQVLGAEQSGDGRWTVTVRIEGDFPGGTADLGYRFLLVDGHVQELHIGT